MSIRIEGESVYVDAEGWRDLVLGPATERDDVLRIPGMEQALAAAAEPSARIQVETVSPGGTFTHLAWIDDSALALLRGHEGDERRLLALPPDHLPAAVARLAGLGPRTSRSENLEVSLREVELWFGDDHQVAVKALARVGADRAWAVTFTPARDAEAEETSFVVVDGPDGLAVVDLHEDRAVLVATTPTQVWRVLAGLTG